MSDLLGSFAIRLPYLSVATVKECDRCWLSGYKKRIPFQERRMQRG